ncbi:MAG: cyanophycin synthetase [Planctomycetota bacterium]
MPIHDDWPAPLYELMQQGKKRIPRPELMRQRTLRFLELLKHPEKNLWCIHVTGTNAKGSVATLLATSLESSGKKIGLFVSPHLMYVSERIRIQGENISLELLQQLSEQTLPIVQQLETEGLVPSFFETILMIALLAFKKENVSFAVLEVGVGGYRDATTCLPSILGVLTTVHWDHMKELGPTLTDIATDKIGVGDASKKLVIGPSLAGEALETIHRECALRKIQVYPSRQWLDRFTWTATHPASGQEGTLLPEQISFHLPFWGVHQRENVAILCECLKLLETAYGLKISEALPAIRKASLPGRLQWVPGTPPWFLDIAHNLEAITNLGKVLNQWVPYEKRKLIFGVSRDKSYDLFLENVAQLAPEIVLVAAAHRGEEPAILAQKLKPWAKKLHVASDIEQGLQTLTQIQGAELGIATGSVFLVGEVLYWLKEKGFA